METIQWVIWQKRRTYSICFHSSRIFSDDFKIWTSKNVTNLKVLSWGCRSFQCIQVLSATLSAALRALVKMSWYQFRSSLIREKWDELFPNLVSSSFPNMSIRIKQKEAGWEVSACADLRKVPCFRCWRKSNRFVTNFKQFLTSQFLQIQSRIGTLQILNVYSYGKSFIAFFEITIYILFKKVGKTLIRMKMAMLCFSMI